MTDPMSDSVAETFLQRLGGEEAVRRWVNLFYDAVSQDAVLAPLFPEDLTDSRDKQFAFFVQYFGGPALYSERYGNPFLRYLHRHVKIGQRERDAWMLRLMETLRQVISDEALATEIERTVGPLADHMINHHPERKDALYFN